MSRIRTVKPEFFRDEELQQLEVDYPTLKPMLFFEGLWCQADRLGNFPWKPKMLHLDILPFIEFDPGASLTLLSEAGLLSQYTGSDGKEYGHIRSFANHQRISGKEAQCEPKYPEEYARRTGEAHETPPGAQERERIIGKGKGKEYTEHKPHPLVEPPEKHISGVTEESFTLDAAVSYVLIETGLAGTKMRDMIREVIYREIKSVEVSPKDAAEAMIAAWRKYDLLDIQFKLSPENFYGRGTWRKPEVEWRKNENGKRADGWLPPQNVASDYVPESTKRRRELDAAKAAGR